MNNVLSDPKPFTKQKEQEIENRIVRARIQMLMKFPFFGILALNLQIEQKYEVGTAATDGVKFYYSPAFIDKLSEQELNWIVVHEVLHPALKHIWRRGDKHKLKWNYACDYAIHDIMYQYIESIQASNTLKMPTGGLYDKKFKDLSAEQIYDMLPDNPEGSGNGKGSGKGSGQQSGKGNGTLDNHDVWDDASTQGGSQSKAQDWEGKLLSAAQSAESKNQGTLPGFLKRLLNNITKPQKDWKTLLAEFVEPEIDDYSFNPPDKRFSEFDLFLPDFNDTTESVKKILVWIDTSGSISDKELSIAYSEVVGAINQFNNKLEGYLGFFDSEAYDTVEFSSVEDVLKIKPIGGGGTCFKAPFKHVKEKFQEDEVAGIIMITDGYCTWPPSTITDIPTLWLVTNETQKAPWGLCTTLKV